MKFEMELELNNEFFYGGKSKHRFRRRYIKDVVVVCNRVPVEEVNFETEQHNHQSSMSC